MFFCYINMVTVEGRKFKKIIIIKTCGLWIQHRPTYMVSFAGPIIFPLKVTRVSSRLCCLKLKNNFDIECRQLVLKLIRKSRVDPGSNVTNYCVWIRRYMRLTNTNTILNVLFWINLKLLHNIWRIKGHC